MSIISGTIEQMEVPDTIADLWLGAAYLRCLTQLRPSLYLDHSLFRLK